MISYLNLRFAERKLMSWIRIICPGSEVIVLDIHCLLTILVNTCISSYYFLFPRELSEIRTQPWLSEGSLTCDPCHHRGPIF